MFKDTRGVIRDSKSMLDTQNNGRKKRKKNVFQIIHRTLQIEDHTNPTKTHGRTQVLRKGIQFLIQ